MPNTVASQECDGLFLRRFAVRAFCDGDEMGVSSVKFTCWPLPDPPIALGLFDNLSFKSFSMNADL